jgi:hypothetical protein
MAVRTVGVLQLYFTRRPLKPPAFVVFCLMLACRLLRGVHINLGFRRIFVHFGIVAHTLWLRRAGGTGGISL